MRKRFRALRLVGTLLRVIAWIVFVVAMLMAVVAVIVGAIQGQAGTPSPLMSDVPVINQVYGLIPGLLVGIALLLIALLYFVLLYAASDAIQVSLSIERNTRETALYLKGESAIPPPPQPMAWEESSDPPLPTD